MKKIHSIKQAYYQITRHHPGTEFTVILFDFGMPDFFLSTSNKKFPKRECTKCICPRGLDLHFSPKGG